MANEQRGESWRRALELRMAAAPPAKQNQLLIVELRDAVKAARRQVISDVAETFVMSDNDKVLDLMQDQTQLMYKVVGASLQALHKK